MSRKSSLLSLVGVVLLAGTPCGVAQDDVPETGFYACIGQVYARAGADLDTLMAGYESELIRTGLLESDEPEAYRGLLQRIASGQRTDLAGYSAFSEQVRGVPIDSLAWRTCLIAVEQFKARNPEATVTRFLDRRNAMILEGISADLQAAALLDILRPRDFRLPFYRLQTYYVLDLQARILANPAERDMGTRREYDLYSNRGANTLRVFLNERDQVVVADQLVTVEALAEQVARHARLFGPDVIYVIEMEEDVKYRQFIALKDRMALAITNVRDAYARNTFGKTLTELSLREKELVESRFPIRIVAP